MYYRVALRVNQPPNWAWKSTPLSSLEAVLLFLKTYHALPKDRLRIFFSASLESMEEMLALHNQGLVSGAVTVEQFMQGKCLTTLETARLQHELAGAGDHDTPYTFTLPVSTPQLLSWLKLRARVERGELEL